MTRARPVDDARICPRTNPHRIATHGTELGRVDQSAARSRHDETEGSTSPLHSVRADPRDR